MVSEDKLKSVSFKSPLSDFVCEISVDRKEALHVDLSEKFKCSERNFARQYAHIYANRLKAMQDTIRKVSSEKWGHNIPLRKLSELAEIKNERCIVIGTLFKHQDLKPSILKEISEENQLVPQPKVSKYICSSDQLILEDEIQRIRLIGNIDVNKLVTGIVIAVLGIENDNGNFEVEDYTFGKMNVDRPIKQTEDSCILIVSGLNVEGTTNLLPLQLLIDWIVGELGSTLDQNSQRKICQVLIAGNSLRSHNSAQTKIIQSDTQDTTDSLTSVVELDKLLLNLVKSVDVVIMPGEFDPSNHTLPQQPIHKCILPQCSQYETLHRVTNPYQFSINGRIILGTSGQPINDIKSLTDFSEDIDILENTLLWNHLAPTAPDTLGCYPYYQEDPFIIAQQPDIYFVGNVSDYDTKLIYLNERPVRLVCVPAFAESQTCALINLKTMECRPLQFKVF